MPAFVQFDDGSFLARHVKGQPLVTCDNKEDAHQFLTGAEARRFAHAFVEELRQELPSVAEHITFQVLHEPGDPI